MVRQLQAGSGCALQGVWRHPGAGVVFHAVDAVGVGGQRIDAALPLQALGQTEAKLSGTAAPAAHGTGHVRTDGDRGFPTTQDDTGPRKGLAPARHGTCQRRMHPPHLARLPFHLIAEDVRGQASGAGQVCRCLQRLLRGGDQVYRMAGKQRVAGFGRFQRAASQRLRHSRRQLNAIARKGSQRVGTGTGIGHGRAAGDGGGVITGHVADGQRHHTGRPAGLRQPATLDAREVLAHVVHLANVGATGQQGAVDGLLVGQAQPVGRQGQQGRAAARDQTQHQVISGQSLGEVQHALGRGQAGSVRHRVGCLHHLDALRQALRSRRYMVVARHNQPAQRRRSRPQRLQGLRHGAAGLARAQHQSAATWRRRQKRRHAVQRQRALDCSAVQVGQEFAGCGAGVGEVAGRHQNSMASDCEASRRGSNIPIAHPA